ncbi:MAG: GTPase [Planctomycetota bacterium]|nr:GTPase [Planctomycetota bacterium]
MSATTSAALVTSPARGGIAVIVLTGPEAERIMREIFRPRLSAGGRERGVLPQSGRLALGRIVNGDEVLDEAIVSRPSSGAIEINIHGGPHVARKVLTLLSERGASIVSDCPVDPVLSETRRTGPVKPAIMKEFLSALPLVSTPLSASAISCQWSGGLSALADSPHPEPDRLREAAEALPLMRRLLEPAEVVIAGPPNVGKSTLANALVGRNVAVVSDRPGTTRDWVCTLTDTDGIPIRLTDTAGLWSQAEGIDAEAVRRAWRRIESSDLVICVTAGDGGEGEYANLVAHLRALSNVINVASKCDIVEPTDRADLAVSAETLIGIDILRREIRDKLGFSDFDPTAAMAFTTRQADHLNTAAEALDRGDRPGARFALDKLLGSSR